MIKLSLLKVDFGWAHSFEIVEVHGRHACREIIDLFVTVTLNLWLHFPPVFLHVMRLLCFPASDGHLILLTAKRFKRAVLGSTATYSFKGVVSFGQAIVRYGPPVEFNIHFPISFNVLRHF